MTTYPAHATIRPARPDDWPFLDQLQRKHHDAIGFLSRMALEHAIARGRVLLAMENGEPAGYLYGKAPYQSQERVAIIFQAAICLDARRRLIGAALVAEFAARQCERIAQVSLWCAADLEANLFWSALGFIPVAARPGAERTGRTHLFWCRDRVRDAPTRRLSLVSTAASAFWIPEFTRGGVIRETRRVTRLPVGWRPAVAAGTRSR
jgi:hypothetical protein